jgi:O-antigen/teichoic acid export membrane protein
MIHSIREKLRFFFTEGHERTILTKKNIAASFGIKGITILISLVLIPLTINYVNSERNGIWLTLYSMTVWLGLFDIGFGNGMKNKLTEAKAKGETALAKQYVSSTYAILSLIFLVLFIVFCLINPYLDWIKILGSNPSLYPYKEEISGLVWIFMASICINFVITLLKPIVTADQRPAISSFLDMLGQLLTLAGIFILYKTTPPSLIYLGLVSGFAPIIVYLIASCFLFSKR